MDNGHTYIGAYIEVGFVWSGGYSSVEEVNRGGHDHEAIELCEV